MDVLTVAPGPLRLKLRPAAPWNYSQARRTPSLIVLHCTDGCEGGGQDDIIAAMFAEHLERKRSAHYVVDADSVTQCVPDMLTAWHCGRTGNARGIGVELCGRASQSPAEWLDVTSRATLALAARLCASLCYEHRIPAVWLDSEALRTPNARGITTHAACSLAWHESTHTDPGVGFPLAAFVAAVSRTLAELRPI